MLFVYRFGLTRACRSAALALGFLASAATAAFADRPNILWISCEDSSPNLGCYGDPIARTPHLDRLASEGVLFRRAFAPAPVCAVTRSGIITGAYPVAIGSHHMRSHIVPPPHVKCFTEYLRAAGYFTTNRSKTDYNFDPPLTAWDRQGENHDDWRGRAPGQPFFSVINLTISHESQIRHGEARHAEVLARLASGQAHDPDEAAATLPPYLPDTPAARRNWAWYHDNISEMDRQAGEILDRLEADGLADSTLVVFWGDHGQGMPRGKRWLYDSGTRVPLIARWPGRLEAASARDDLVSLLDLPPTMLAVAGAEVPGTMHGRVILGPKAQPEPRYLFFHRDRMDEAYDLQRAVRDRRFKYIRNFEPEKPFAQGIDYMDQMPAMRDWRRLHAEGRLTAAQSRWFAPAKPVEELYDTEKDPHEIENLAERPEHAAKLRELRAALEAWQVEVGDLGMLPEPILMRRMRPRGELEPTAKPKISIEAAPGGGATLRTVRIECATEGASIAFGLDAATDDAGRRPMAWKLYAGPFAAHPGDRVRAKACRLGFRDSAVVTAEVE